MREEIFDVIDNIENSLCGLEMANTLLNEVSHDVDKVIIFDNSEEDKSRISNLLNRRPVLSNFISMATDYIFQTKKTLHEIIDKYNGGGV